MRLILFSKAKDEVNRLQRYIDLVESYETETIEQKKTKHNRIKQ